MSNVREKPTPKNQETKFTIDEMFFSTTDSRGIIIAGNETFVRISGYSKEELIGSPHNIVRHPDMPKAVFKLLWSRIQDKKPIVAYVKNMTTDGSYYWVLAVVFPAKEKYISIRIKPSSSYFQLIQKTYQEMREAERSGGVEASTKILLETLQSNKFENYESFMIAALTEELKCKDRALLHKSNDESTALIGHKASGEANDHLGYFRSLYTSSQTLGNYFGEIFEKLDDFISLNTILQEKSQFMLALSREIRILSLNAAVESARIEGAGASLSVLAKEMGSYSKTSENEINKINDDIKSVALELEKVIFNIGAAKLQVNMVTFFAAELIKKQTGSEALTDGIEEIKANSADLLETLEPFAREATSLISDVKDGLSDLIKKLEQLDSMVRTLELIHVNGMIEAARVGEGGKGFVALFNQMLKSVERAKVELKEFRKSIVQIMNEADSIVKMESVIFESINKINLGVSKV